MISFETIVPLVIEAVCGATGGLAFGHWVNSASMGRSINALAGAVGGLLLTWLVARTPWVDRFVGGGVSGEPVAVLEPSLVIGVGVAGLIGGAMFVLALGAFRRSAGTWDV